MCYCEGIFERKKQHFRSNQNHWGREGGVAWRNQGSDSTGALQHMEQKPGFSAVCLCSRRVILPLFTQSQSASACLSPLLSAPLTPNLLGFCSGLRQMTARDGLFKASPSTITHPVSVARLKNTTSLCVRSLSLSAPHVCSSINLMRFES